MKTKQLQTLREEEFSSATWMINVRRSTWFPRTGMYWVTFRQVKDQPSGCKKQIISYEKDRYCDIATASTTFLLLLKPPWNELETSFPQCLTSR